MFGKKEKPPSFFRALKSENQNIFNVNSDEMNMVDRLMIVGVDYKGCLQFCYDDKGVGLGADLIFDPARLTTGLFSVQAQVGLQGSRSSKLFLIVQRYGPASNSVINVINPISVNSMKGISWSGGVRASLFAGVAVDMSVGVSAPTVQDISDLSRIKMVAETVSVGLKAEAGVAAALSSEGSHFYAEDLAPMMYMRSESTNMRSLLEQLMTRGSIKTYIKERACDFLLQNKRYFGSVEAKERYGLLGYDLYSRNVPVDKIRFSLQSGLDKLPASSNLSMQGTLVLDSLSPWLDKTKRPLIPTSLRISAGKAAGAGSATAIAVAKIPSSSIQASASLISMETSWSATTSRFQSVYKYIRKPVGRPESLYHLVMTQDTRVVYKESKLSLPSATLKVKGLSVGPIASKGLNKTISTSTLGLRRMTYISATIYWSFPTREPEYGLYKADSLTGKIGGKYSVAAELGTGVSYGASFSIESILKCYQENIQVVSSLKERAASAIKKYTDTTRERFRGDFSVNALSKLENMVAGDSTNSEILSYINQLIGDPAKMIVAGSRVALGRGSDLRRILEEEFKRSAADGFDVSVDVSIDISDYLQGIASELRLTMQQLKNFLGTPNVKELLESQARHDAASLGSIILEASFRVPGFLSRNKVSLTLTEGASGGMLNKTTSPLLEVDLDVSRDIINMSRNDRVLESIAMRYRLIDKESKNKSRPLGFTALGQGASLSFNTIDESGLSGVVDLHRVWCHGLNFEPTGNVEVMESSVPPVALFITEKPCNDPVSPSFQPPSDSKINF